MSFFHGKKLKLITLIYWLLLIYIIAALVWWFISLEKQNSQMSELKYKLVYSQSHQFTPDQIDQQLQAIHQDEKRNTRKYIAEGITFLILILIGASFVYRAVRRQFRLQQQQQNFMMAVTHELKTPISVARLNLETLLKHQLDPEKQKKILQMTLQETTRLNSLTNNILISSELEGGGYHMAKEELDISSLVNDCLQEARSRYPDRVFLQEVDPEIELTGDSLLLKIMINNLLENAVKYSPRHTPITCRLKKTGDAVALHIIDEGSGIPDTEKKKIFEKFYRIGNEATRKSQGTGLGLYLCRKIARDHNADITVTNHIPAGSNFVVTFYR